MTPIQEYRKWLNIKLKYLKLGCISNPGNAILIAQNESALNKFNELFPEDTQTLPDHLDKIPGMHEDTSETVLPNRDYQEGDEKWKLTDGIVPTRLVQFDETDNIYPKTQPHSFPPRD